MFLGFILSVMAIEGTVKSTTLITVIVPVLAFVKPWERRMNVYVRDIETGAEKRVTSATERDIAGFFWKGSDRIVYIQDKGTWFIPRKVRTL